MIATGIIEAEKVAGVWWIPAASLARLEASQRHGGRPFNPASAWALLLSASGESADWVPSKVRWRIAGALKEQGLAGVFGKLVRRAKRHAYEVHVGELPRLVDGHDLMLSGVSAARLHQLGLQGGDEVETYVAASAVEKITRDHGLATGSEPNVILRAIPDDVWTLVRRPVAPIAAVLTDLAEHSDARARRIAREQASRLGRGGS